MLLKQLNSSSFEEVIYEKEKPCLVIFSRKNCHVCKDVYSVLEELNSKHFGGFGFYRVDVEEDRDLFQKFSLKGVPQILFFNKGEYKGKLAGKVEDSQVEEKIVETLT